MRLQRIAFHRAVRILTGILPVVIVAFVTVAVWNYWARTRDVPAKTTLGGNPLSPDVAVHTGAFTYESAVDGKRKFSIQGTELVAFRDNRNLLSDVNVVVFGQKEGDLDRRIHGDKCSYAAEGNVDSSKVRCDGHVSVELDPGTIAHTEELHYDSQTGLISSPVATRLERPGHMTGTAGEMQYFLDLGLLRLTKHADIELTEGGSLHGGVAVFQQKENWVTISQGIEISSANGSLRGGSGRADLAPGTYRPTKVTMENGASMESRSMAMKSDWLQSELTPEGKAQHVLARGSVVAKSTSTDDKSLSGTLSGPEIETWLNELGRPDVIEARQHPEFESGDKGTLTAENTIHIDYGPRSIKTAGASKFTSDTNSITGRDFLITSDEKRNDRVFTTSSRATLESPDMTTDADSTTARIDGATNKIVSLEQAGKVTFKEKKGERHGHSGKLTITGGDKIVLERDDPEVTEGPRILKGQTITIFQADKSFIADGGVTMADTSTKTQPVIVKAGHANGNETRIDYTRNVELFPGTGGKIDTQHLVAYLKQNRFEADGGVVSLGNGFDVSSGRLVFTDNGDGLQNARYTGDAVATQKDMQGVVVLVLKTQDLEVHLRSGQMETLVAIGKVDVTQGDRKGYGERLDYDAATGDMVLTGTSAAQAEIHRGEEVVRGCSIRITKNNGGGDATPCAGGSVKSEFKINKN